MPCSAFAGWKELKCNLPAVVRLSKDREGAIEIQIKNEQQKEKRIPLGLALPREFSTPQEDLRVQLPGQSHWSRLAWPCTPLRRGNYQLDKCHLETVSPLGFWAVRAAAPVRSEIRVYPNLLRERNSAAAIFLNRGVFGIHN